jgi:hypothetical protein
MERGARFSKEHVERIVVGDNFHPMPNANLGEKSVTTALFMARSVAPNCRQ